MPPLNPGSQPLRVLHIEDDPVDAAIVQRLVGDAIELTHVTRVDRAPDETAFDAAILDLRIPPFQDCEAVQELRKHRPYLPVVVVTGTADRGIHRRCRAFGAHAVLEKDSLSAASLIEALNEACEAARAEQSDSIERLRAASHRLRSLAEEMKT